MDSCPLSVLIDVRALRCISKDVPMLVCICPLCKKHPGLTHQLHNIARAYWLYCSWRQNKSREEYFFWLTCLVQETISQAGKITCCRLFFIGFFHSLQELLRARKIQRARQKTQKGTMSLKNVTSVLFCFNYAVSPKSWHLIKSGGSRINGRIQLISNSHLAWLRLHLFHLADTELWRENCDLVSQCKI